jgi:hypothetical protein
MLVLHLRPELHDSFFAPWDAGGPALTDREPEQVRQASVVAVVVKKIHEARMQKI